MTQFPPPEDPVEDRTSRPPTQRTPPAEPTRPNEATTAGQAPPPHRPPTHDGPEGKAPVVRGSRFGELWIGLIVAAVILVLLLVFVLQNLQTVRVDYFGLTGHLPLAVAILLGVAAGALLVALPGTVRILQLRKAARR
jgi:lipopolysaccharide assembly protein A